MVGFLVKFLTAAVAVSLTHADFSQDSALPLPPGYSRSSSLFPPPPAWDATVGPTTCIQSRMGVQLGIVYRNKDNATASIRYSFLPGETRITGSCEYKMQALVLKTAFSELELQFGRDVVKGINMWFVEGVKVHLSYPSLPDASPLPEAVSCQAGRTNLTALRTRYGTSTVCAVHDFVLDVTCGVTEALVTGVTVTLYELQLEAFRRGTLGHFSRSVPCHTDPEHLTPKSMLLFACINSVLVVLALGIAITCYRRKKRNRGLYIEI